LAKIVRCPKCGYAFSLSYSRALMCTGCHLSVMGNCGYAVCPNCGYEFPLSLSQVKERREKVRLA